MLVSTIVVSIVKGARPRAIVTASSLVAIRLLGIVTAWASFREGPYRVLAATAKGDPVTNAASPSTIGATLMTFKANRISVLAVLLHGITARKLGTWEVLPAISLGIP